MQIYYYWVFLIVGTMGNHKALLALVLQWLKRMGFYHHMKNI